MGAYCTKHCTMHIPNTRRRRRRGASRQQRARRLEAYLTRCDCRRMRSVRDTAFRSGFHLGLEASKLTQLTGGGPSPGPAAEPPAQLERLLNAGSRSEPNAAKLERLLKVLDAGHDSRSEPNAALCVHNCDEAQFEKDVSVVSVSPDASVPCVVADNELHAAGQTGHHCCLDNMIKEDFKWVLEPDRCEGHHPGSPSSLP